MMIASTTCSAFLAALIVIDAGNPGAVAAFECPISQPADTAAAMPFVWVWLQAANSINSVVGIQLRTQPIEDVRMTLDEAETLTDCVTEQLVLYQSSKNKKVAELSKTLRDSSIILRGLAQQNTAMFQKYIGDRGSKGSISAEEWNQFYVQVPCLTDALANATLDLRSVLAPIDKNDLVISRKDRDELVSYLSRVTCSGSYQEEHRLRANPLRESMCSFLSWLKSARTRNVARHM
ncbi:MAG TPA: hypothetical protein VN634_17755 [Candidatus Limnocylindrales bacterium]|nr:hypothetical protein [Candidatus Limnocylindrales bacterium]